MNEFIIRVENGGDHTSFGAPEHLGGMSPQYQTPKTYAEDGSFLVITYDGGAKRRIPLRRILYILEG